MFRNPFKVDWVNRFVIRGRLYLYKRLPKLFYMSQRNWPVQVLYLQPIITQYFIDNKSEIWLLFLIAHSKR